LATACGTGEAQTLAIDHEKASETIEVKCLTMAWLSAIGAAMMHAAAEWSKILGTGAQKTRVVAAKARALGIGAAMMHAAAEWSKIHGRGARKTRVVAAKARALGIGAAMMHAAAEWSKIHGRGAQKTRVVAAKARDLGIGAAMMHALDLTVKALEVAEETAKAADLATNHETDEAKVCAHLVGGADRGRGTGALGLATFHRQTRFTTWTAGTAKTLRICGIECRLET
jgi:GNAT superfamily N-acetyltransferase